jgi:hypothetical protein
MNRLTRLAVATVVGLLAFVAVTVAATAVLAPRVELSLLVGLPAGVFAGVTALFATATALRYRDAPVDADGRRPASAGRWRRAGVGAALGNAVALAGGAALFVLADLGVGLSVLALGGPVLAAVGTLVGYSFPAHRDREEGGRSRPVVR